MDGVRCLFNFLQLVQSEGRIARQHCCLLHIVRYICHAALPHAPPYCGLYPALLPGAKSVSGESARTRLASFTTEDVEVWQIIIGAGRGDP